MTTEVVERIEDLLRVDVAKLKELDTNVLRRQMRHMRETRRDVQQTLEQTKTRVKDLNQAIRTRLDIVRNRIAEEKMMRESGTLPRRKRGPKPKHAPDGIGEDLAQAAVAAAKSENLID
jgi:vacuolar-type H+-ATPase subunit I/STV1